ncbi:MAG: substrate-binding domain-containing protein [Thermoflexales bacterium]
MSTHALKSARSPISIVGATLAVLALAGCAAAPASAPTAGSKGPPRELILSTTTSTNDSGLLPVILPDFEAKFNATVKVVAVGTGAAIKLGQDGNADVVLVHARAQEDEFVRSGFGINRRDVMYNDFILVGPAADPAKVAGLPSVADALKRIAAAPANFVSRGDKSGTNTKELELWKAAGIEPAGAWYAAIGQGMGPTLVAANEKNAYTLTDRATWLAQAAKLQGLKVLVGGNAIAENKDKALLNPYGVILVNPAKHPTLKADLAEAFAAWITSLPVQEKIAAFGKVEYGQPLFYSDSEAWRAVHP